MEQKRKADRKDRGHDFEKLVTGIQEQLDPAAQVQHNELIKDRLGHQRQFDVVVRGTLGGHPVLGVFECKDLKRRVGTQDIEAFVTKSRDVNANLKVFVSKRGFTKQAMDKARDYGIQTLSLLPEHGSESTLIGTRWYADIYYWKALAIEVLFGEDQAGPVSLDVYDIKINGQLVVDWFKNYLNSACAYNTDEGWSVHIEVPFKALQVVEAKGQRFLSKGLRFSAERGCDKKVKTIGWTGTGFYDWQAKQPKTVPHTKLRTGSIPVDFDSWDERGSEKIDEGAFLYGRFKVFMKSFEIVRGAIDLETL